MFRPLRAETTAPFAIPGAHKAAGWGRAKKAETAGFLMALRLYFPGQLSWHRVGSGTFRAVDGCQRVVEPSLSPLLYKKLKTSPPRAGEYLVVRQMYAQKFFRRKQSGEKIF
jgi:hypothetical protein